MYLCNAGRPERVIFGVALVARSSEENLGLKFRARDGKARIDQTARSNRREYHRREVYTLSTARG